MVDGQKPDIWETFESLAERARREQPPEVDVVMPVLRRLRQYRLPSDRGLWILTAGALAAAALVLAVSLPYFATAMDPLTALMETTATSLI